MRLAAGLLAVALTSVVTSAKTPSSTDSSSLANGLSTVYFSSHNIHTKSSNDVPLLAHEDAMAILGHRLGYSQFYPEPEPAVMEQFIGTNDPVTELFGEGKGRGRVILYMTDIKRDFLSDIIKPAFTAPGPLRGSWDHRHLLQNKLIKGAQKLYGEGGSSSRFPLWQNYFPRSEDAFINIDIVPLPLLGAPLSRIQSWDNFVNIVGAETASKFRKDSKSTQIFVYSYLQLLNSFKSDQVTEAINNGGYVFIYNPTFMHIDQTLDSEEAEAAYSLYHEFLSEKLISSDSPQFTVILIPPSPSSFTGNTYRDDLKKRDANEIPFSFGDFEADIQSSPPTAPPSLLTDTKPEESHSPKKSRIPRYFESKKKCESTTSHCSTHGECVKSDHPKPNQWSCKCNATSATPDGVKTYWGGNGCQKVDISVQFNLMFWFGVAMVTVMIGAVSAMYSMGAQELPGVLTAGMAGVKKTT